VEILDIHQWKLQMVAAELPQYLQKKIHSAYMPAFLKVIGSVSHLVLENVCFPQGAALYSEVPYSFSKLKRLDVLGYNQNPQLMKLFGHLECLKASFSEGLRAVVFQSRSSLHPS
jgi:hypothetical protein